MEVVRGKLFVVLSVAALMFTGCSEPKQKSGENAPVVEDGANKGETGKEKVENKSTTVEITLPASMFQGEQNIENTIAKAKEQGVDEVKKNDDGSLTYTMSKDTHSKILGEMRDSLTQSIEELKSGQDFKSIKDVIPNDSFSEVTFVVDRAAYEKSFDGFASIGIAIAAMYYQIFEGASDESKVAIKLQDESTKEVFKTIEYPDALKNPGK
ncbi:hypothetical protein [Paenibacillus sp. 32O-W]|uniref:hypothetical protein n=1 Tax=Paenibacillus sp. 32O-W TaxID=1695218 RepID=UPI001C92C313|nr:hypothetical protein [Paenibacillus sp. 32O-W]